jgi:hypothetical protein
MFSPNIFNLHIFSDYNIIKSVQKQNELQSGNIFNIYSHNNLQYWIIYFLK